MRPLRASLLSALLLAITASTAHATTFCVPAFHSACPAGAVVHGSLQTAITADDDDGAADRILVAPGTLTAAGEVETAVGGTDDLEIVGAGAGATVLTTSSTSAPNVLDLEPGSRATTVRDLTVRIPASLPDGAGNGVRVEDDVLDGVDVENRNAGSSGVLTPLGGSAFRNGRIYEAEGGTLAAGVLAAQSANGIVAVEDARVEGAETAVRGDTSVSVQVRRTRIVQPESIGVSLGNGAVGLVENSIIETSGGAWPVVASSTGDDPVAGFVRHVTVVGTVMDPNRPAFLAHVGDQADTASASLSISDVIVQGFAVTWSRDAPTTPSIGNATISLRYSHVKPIGQAEGDGATTSEANIDATASDALLAGPDDFRLRPGSPAIDAGDPLLIGVTATDFTGAARPVDGNGDGVARRDMGAYEHVPPPPPSGGDPPPATTQPTAAPPADPPSQAAPASPGARDTRRPAVSRLRFGRRVSARRGGTVSLTLSEPASVQITFRPGGKRPVTLRFRGKAGVNRFTIGKRRLRARVQLVTVVAVDAAGNRSKGVTTRVKVGR